MITNDIAFYYYIVVVVIVVVILPQPPNNPRRGNFQVGLHCMPSGSLLTRGYMYMCLSARESI